MIVFVTLYLGLIAGRQPIEMRVDPAVKTVRLFLDGQKIDAFGAPPWSTVVDFGPTLQPHELVAAGFNEQGDEIARVSQFINLPRPTAEMDIILDRDALGTPTRATLKGMHVSYVAPRKASLKLDVVPLSLDRNYRAKLPALDMKRPHDLSAEMRFADGTVARREVVFGGEFAEEMPTQLTPTAVMRTGTSEPPLAADCFVSHGEPLRVSSVEKAESILVIVRDPDPAEIKTTLFPTAAIGGRIDTAVMREAAKLDPDTMFNLLSPAADSVTVPDQPTAILFPSFVNLAPKEGLFWFLTNMPIRGSTAGEPRRWADAVAVAAIKAVSGGRRRAVLLVAGSAPDASLHSPASVRHYLASLGVPLFVWSAGDAVDPEWGPAADVSSMEKMIDAAKVIRSALDAQRIAWIYADPLTALRAEVKETCGYARLGR